MSPLRRDEHLRRHRVRTRLRLLDLTGCTVRTELVREVHSRTGSDEHYVLDLCDQVLGIPARRQQRFDWLRGDPSPTRSDGSTLPVDGYWPQPGLVVEFQEEQHSQPSPFFDRRQTVSGVGRGEQRRLYDERKRIVIPAHGLRLVVIKKAVFTLKSKRIARDRARDVAVVREHLELG